jgi:hypothetical protein
LCRLANGLMNGPAAVVDEVPVQLIDDRMSHAPLNADIRRIVTDTFAELGLSDGNEPCETILIRGGAYTGRRFDVANGHAIWSLDEQQLKFFRCDGSVAQTFELSPGAGRQAA